MKKPYKKGRLVSMYYEESFSAGRPYKNRSATAYKVEQPYKKCGFVSYYMKTNFSALADERGTSY